MTTVQAEKWSDWSIMDLRAGERDFWLVVTKREIESERNRLREEWGRRRGGKVRGGGWGRKGNGRGRLEELCSMTLTQANPLSLIYLISRVFLLERETYEPLATKQRGKTKCNTFFFPPRFRWPGGDRCQYKFSIRLANFFLIAHASLSFRI